MSYELVTGNTGTAVTPTKDGNLNKALVGKRLICMGLKDVNFQNALDLISSRDTNGNYVYHAYIHAGTYMFGGRHIIIYDDQIYDVASIEDGTLVGFMYNRDNHGFESFEPALRTSDAVLLEDIDLQNSGMIVFGVLGLNESSPYIKEEKITYTKTLEYLSNPIVYSDHQTGITLSVGAEKILSVPEGIITRYGRFLAILSLQLLSAPTTDPATIKLRFEGNSAYDYVIDSKEASIQVVGIHEFKASGTTNLALDAYIWHPSEALRIKDMKFQLFQLL